LKEIINCPKEMYEVSKHFAEGRSGGIVGGTIGALDVVIVIGSMCSRIKKIPHFHVGFFMTKGAMDISFITCTQGT
jgi:hypothetical protein